MAVGGASEVVYLPHARVLGLKEGAPPLSRRSSSESLQVSFPTLGSPNHHSPLSGQRLLPLYGALGLCPVCPVSFPMNSPSDEESHSSAFYVTSFVKAEERVHIKPDLSFL